MSTVIEIVASLLTSGVAVGVLIVFVIRRRVHRSNRLVAGRRSEAPARWLWSPGRAAMMHRRLRACCQVALAAAATSGATTAAASPRARARRLWRRSAAPLGPFERIAAEMIDHAVALDARLVGADRRPGAWRRHALAEVAPDVRRLEASAQRLERLAREWQAHVTAPPLASGPGPMTGGAPAELGDRLDALEATLAELRNPEPLSPGPQPQPWRIDPGAALRPGATATSPARRSPPA